MLLLALVVHLVGRAVTLPVNDPRFTSGSGFSWEVNTRAFEDYSYFGAVGGLVAIGIPLLALWEVRGGRVDRRALVLAVGLPVYIALFALTAKYNEWVSRFMLAPVALTAPLYAPLFRRRLIGFTLAGTAALAVLLTHLHNEHKPLDTGWTPWATSQAQVIGVPWEQASAQIEHIVPQDAPIGAPPWRQRPSLPALRAAPRSSRELPSLPRCSRRSGSSPPPLRRRSASR